MKKTGLAYAREAGFVFAARRARDAARKRRSAQRGKGAY
ncbi:hypothetical protein C7S17_3979 [Burkholderia thailandensis]|nr:hypothetical protein [Burkholderia thailandensis]